MSCYHAAMYNSPRLHLASWRGHAIEGVHPVHAILSKADGTIVERVGFDVETTWRSSAKPFQLEATLGLVPEEKQKKLTDRALAVAAASHNAEQIHLRAVRSIFKLFELEETALRCGAHDPMGSAANNTLIRARKKPTPIHNNCSGKHAMMLAAAACNEQDLETYLEAGQLVQKAIFDTVSERTGVEIEETVVDGCGAPCFVLPLSAMARAWANLGEATQDEESGILGRIGRAMAAHPDLVSGSDRLDVALPGEAQEPLITKIGAAGLLCGTLPERKLGFAMKIGTGNGDLRGDAARAILYRWFPEIFEEAPEETPILNVVGEPVGRIEPIWEMPKPKKPWKKRRRRG